MKNIVHNCRKNLIFWRVRLYAKQLRLLFTAEGVHMSNGVRKIGFLAIAAAMNFLITVAPAQQQEATTPPATDENVMMPEQFTETLKQVWSFLKNEMDDYLTSIQSRDEFETASEYERRATDSRRQYLAKVMKFSRDQKLDQREFMVLFKADLGTYDADKQMYPLSSPTVVDAPYNIPTVQCMIRKNPYVALADSIRKGYRTSSLYVNLPRGNKWQVSRDLARAAKADEDQIYFRVKAKIDIEKNDVRNQAVLEIVPNELALVNNKTNQVYWTVPIR